MTSLLPSIIYITVHIPTTTLGWEDETTTVVRLDATDSYDIEKAILFAIAKKALGSTNAVMQAIDTGKLAEQLFKLELETME